MDEAQIRRDSAFEPHEGWETLETDTVTKADGRNWTVAVQGWTHGRGRGPFRVIYREGAHGRFSGHPVGHWVIGGYNPANRELLGRRAASVMRDNLIVTLGGRRQEGRWVVDASRVPAGWEFETAPGRAENPDRERYGHQYSYSVQLQLLAIVRFLAFFTQGSSTLLERVNTLVDDVNTTADKPWPTTEEFQAFVKRAKALAVSVERKWPADTDAHNQMVLAVHALSGLPHLWSLRKRDRLTEAGLETDNG